MGKISTFNISKLVSIFQLIGGNKDFLFIDQDRYTPATEEPFRTDTYAISFLKEGSLRITTGLNTEVVSGPSMLTIGPSIIRTIQRIDTNPLVDLLFFSESFFLEDHVNVFSLSKFTFFEDAGAHVLPLQDSIVGKFTTLFGLLRQTVESGHLHKKIILRNYIHIILCEIDAAVAGRKPGPPHISPLLAHFRTLLSREVLRQRSVRYYAEQLHVTPKYLSELVKQQTGRTAGEWIDQTVILEAKVLLQKKDMSIAQVADSLNFSDQSAFGKFFKVNTGISPLNYRNALD